MLTRFSPLFACPRPVSISPRFLFIRFKKILCLTVSDLRPPIADPRFTRLRLFVPDSCLSVSELSRPFVRPSLTSVYPSQSSVHPSETYIHPPTLLCLAILGLCPLFPDLCSSITDFCPPRPLSTYFLLHLFLTTPSVSWPMQASIHCPRLRSTRVHSFAHPSQTSVRSTQFWSTARRRAGVRPVLSRLRSG